MKNNIAPFYHDKKVLVTGGAGFIGSHLVEQLVHSGAEVTILDNFSTGCRENLINVHNNITIVVGDITDFATCVEATCNQDIIFHCAALVSVPASLEQPQRCFEQNIVGTHNLLEASRHNAVQRFIFSSSSAVYGTHAGACKEDMQCVPTSPYGFSKLIGEQLCKQYAHIFGLQTICLRYFNVYGSRQQAQGPYASVRAQFIEKLKLNQPIIIFGNGQQTRDFVPVEKVVSANMHLGTLSSDLLDGRPINIATGTSKTILKLLEELKTEFPQFSAPISFSPARPGDIMHSVANCEQLMQLQREF